MKYVFNNDFFLSQQEISGFGNVDFLRSEKSDQIIVLDSSAKVLIEKIHNLGAIDSEQETDNPTLKHLISEGALLQLSSPTEKLTNNISIKNLNFWLQVTDRCNLACSYCYIPSLNSKKKLRSDFFDLLEKKLIDLNGLESVHIKIAGGEPLLSFDKWKDGIMRLCDGLQVKGISLSLRIITNLTVLTEEIMVFIRDNDIAISVSLDGLANFNDKNRIYLHDQKGSFEDVEKNLRRLKEFNIKPSVMITATSENKDGIPALIDYLITNDITFRIADAKGGHIKPEEFEEVMRLSSEIIKKGINNGYPVSSRIVISDLRTLSPQSTPCSMGKNSAALYLDGSIYFCHTEFESGEPIGHLEEQEDILTIIQRGREKHFGLSEDCKKCEYRLVCAGGCPLYRVNGKSPMCLTYKKIIPQVYELYEQERKHVQN